LYASSLSIDPLHHDESLVWPRALGRIALCVAPLAGVLTAPRARFSATARSLELRTVASHRGMRRERGSSHCRCMTTVHHRYASINGRSLFYREAGPVDAPSLVLLHGFPTSSFMFRELMPQLADRYHVIAPDYLGFGLSDAPPVLRFHYTFDALADLVAQLLSHLGLDRYAIYVQDYGAPVGWRLALTNPQAISAIVTQNGNGYEAGFTQSFWQPVREYWHDQSPQAETAVRGALTLESIKWQYLHGVSDVSVVSPDTWHHDHALISRPGNDLVQLQLFADYASNLALYPKLHAYLRASHVPLLAIWGRNDEIFGPAGALAFADDAPDAEIHLLDGGHFLLESQLDTAASYLRGFLGSTL
jgi:pimeloyl-ACP methyl ester carboxylesterase